MKAAFLSRWFLVLLALRKLNVMSSTLYSCSHFPDVALWLLLSLPCVVIIIGGIVYKIKVGFRDEKSPPKFCRQTNRCYLVLKTVNRKPICRPKDSDPVMFRFLQTKTGFITYFIILP